MTAPTIVCPQCASNVSDGEEFCPVCGDFLGWRADQVVTELVVLDEPLPVEPPSPAEKLVVDENAHPEPVLVEGPEAEALPPQTLPTEELLVGHREARRLADERVAEAQAAAARAQVRLERTRRRAASARQRLERLTEELPAAEQHASDAEAAAERAAAAVQRAKRAVAASRSAARKEELRKRARSAVRAEQRARTASRQAQEALATLSGVLQGVSAEVAEAPAEVARAKKARDAARAQVRAALAQVVTAAAELSLQERLLQLRATPRRVVAMPESAERELREQAQQDADQAAQDVTRRGGEAEKRQLRRAELEDQRRDQAEQQSDERELHELVAGAGQAKRAADAAERAGEVPPPEEVEELEPVHRQPAAMLPEEVRRRGRRTAAVGVASGDGPLKCRACAAGNASSRHLCRVCGAVLVSEAPASRPVARLSWWRRLLRLPPPEPRDAFVPAGARPMPGGNRRTAAAVRRARVGGASALRGGPRSLWVAAAAVVAVLASVLSFVLTPLGGAVADLVSGGRDQVRKASLVETAVVPSMTKASSSALTSGPAFAVDGDLTTSWTAGTRPGTAAVLSLFLQRRTDLVAVRLTSAAGTGRPRPASVTVDAPGVPPIILRLKDSLQTQRLPLRIHSGQIVRIRIDDVYPGAAPGLSAGFAEVELVTLSPRGLTSS